MQEETASRLSCESIDEMLDIIIIARGSGRQLHTQLSSHEFQTVGNLLCDEGGRYHALISPACLREQRQACDRTSTWRRKTARSCSTMPATSARNRDT